MGGKASRVKGHDDECVIVGIDPGTEQSAWVEIQLPGLTVLRREILPNEEVVEYLRDTLAEYIAIEMIACYGMSVGAEVFETCVWIGRMIEARRDATLYPVARVFRREVKMALCGSVRAKDANVRQALIDLYGPGKDKAVGLKASPGPLYGVRKDMWQALGVAVTFAKRMEGVK